MHIRRFAVTMAALALCAASPARATAQSAATLKNAMMLPMAPGGGDFYKEARLCPDGSVMTGLRARVGVVIDAVGLRCRTVNSDGSLGAETSVAPWMGSTGGTERIRSCPTGTVAVGQRLGIVPAPQHLIAIGLECRGWNASTRTTTGSVALVQVVSSAVAMLTTYSARCSEPSHAIRGFRGMDAPPLGIASLGFTCSAP